jgi:hypothetical protein
MLLYPSSARRVSLHKKKENRTHPTDFTLCRLFTPGAAKTTDKKDKVPCSRRLQAPVSKEAIIRPNKNRPTSDLVKRPVSPARRDKQSSTRLKARRLALLELFRAYVHRWLADHSDWR